MVLSTWKVLQRRLTPHEGGPRQNKPAVEPEAPDLGSDVTTPLSSYVTLGQPLASLCISLFIYKMGVQAPKPPQWTARCQADSPAEDSHRSA